MIREVVDNCTIIGTNGCIEILKPLQEDGKVLLTPQINNQVKLSVCAVSGGPFVEITLSREVLREAVKILNDPAMPEKIDYEECASLEDALALVFFH